MKQFEVNALGLEEIKPEEQKRIEGGLPQWVKDLVPSGVVVAAWEWINEHWDALVEGFERGAEEGAELYMG